jgi:hypothetical protein
MILFVHKIQRARPLAIGGNAAIFSSIHTEKECWLAYYLNRTCVVCAGSRPETPCRRHNTSAEMADEVPNPGVMYTENDLRFLYFSLEIEKTRRDLRHAQAMPNNKKQAMEPHLVFKICQRTSNGTPRASSCASKGRPRASSCASKGRRMRDATVRHSDARPCSVWLRGGATHMARYDSCHISISESLSPKLLPAISASSRLIFLL